MIAVVAKWAIVGMFALGCLFTIAAVGKPRKPLEPRTAALIVLFNSAYIVAIVLFWRTS